jgi:hypothetical protein
MVVVAAILWLSQSSNAAVIVGGSSLLSASNANQLEAWLGEGPITLTNIFTKTPGSGKTSVDFHNAVNGQGRTFSVVEVLPGTYGGYGYSGGTVTFTQSQIVGGYNPQSWWSYGSWNYSMNDADRTAFLFNLNAMVRHSQHLGDMTGIYQTLNDGSLGPTFGGGYDLGVYSDLSTGFTYNYSYGTPEFTQDILCAGGYYTANLNYGTIEVFTISGGENAVPEPVSLAVWALFGGLGIAVVRRRTA